MKSLSRAARVMLGVAGVATAVVSLSACGDNSQAASPENTILSLNSTNFSTQPPVTTAPSTVPLSTEPQTTTEEYTIVANDSLPAIASRFGVTVEAIVAANDEIENASTVIYPDQVIIIPGATTTAGSSTAGSSSDSSTNTASQTSNSTPTASEGDSSSETATEDSSSTDCPTTYTIKPGDTTRIGVAERFGITYQEMDAANSGTAGYENFIPGTEIKIPCPG